jgi:hypothetical protein
MQGQLGMNPKKPLITLQSSDDKKTLQVYVGFLHYETVPNDLKSLQYRQLVARFAVMGFPIALLSREFKFSRPTVIHFKEIMANATDEKEMFTRLRGYNRQKTKLVPEVEAYLKGRFATVYADNRGSYNRQLRQEAQELFKVELSPEALRQVIAPLRHEIDGKVKAAATTTPVVEDSPLPPRSENQQRQALAVAEEIEAMTLGVESLDNSFSHAEPAPLEAYLSLPGMAESVPQATVESQPLETDQEKGQLYLHAGLLVLNLWLADFAKAFKSWGGFLLQWLYQIFTGAVNFERARYLARHEFSRFLGRTAMSVSKSRAFLKKLAHKYFVPCLNMLFKVNLENIIKTLEKAVSYFYADGHFDPYYGQTGILPGWCCLLNRTMKGSNHYMIHNELGYPLFKELKDCFDDFRVFIKHAIQKIKVFVAGARFGMIFDRGGFSQDLFRAFHAEGAYYLTWEKYFDIEKESALVFDIAVTIEREINQVGCVRPLTFNCAETTYRIDDELSCRKLVIRCEDKSAEDSLFYASILTNDPTITAQRMVELMTGRWSCQENDFRYEKKHFGLDQITSYDVLPAESIQGRIDEQKGLLEALKKNLTESRDQRQQLLAQLGIKRLTKKAKARLEKDADRDPQSYERMQALQALQPKLQELSLQINQLEKKIKRLEKIEAKGYVRLDYRKKQLFDHLRFTARNIFYNAIAEFRTYYPNLRDLHVVFWKLVRSSGYIKSHKGKIIVTLICPFFEGRVRRAVGRFLEALNAKEPVLLDGSRRQIVFRLES